MLSRLYRSLEHLVSYLCVMHREGLLRVQKKGNSSNTPGRLECVEGRWSRWMQTKRQCCLVLQFELG